MIGPGKRPQVPRLVARGLDGDARSCRAVDEEARSHREFRAPKGTSELLADDAVGAVGSKHVVDVELATIGSHGHPARLAGDVNGFFGNQARAGCDGGFDERAIEHGAADDEQRTVGRGVAVDERDVRTALGAFDRRRLHDDRRQRLDVDDVADQRECAPRQPAAARFLARMARIEEHDRCARAREAHRRHRARRSRADNGDSHGSSSSGSVRL